MTTNEDIIRQLYALAEGTGRDADKFAALFHADGFFQDESSGMRLYGRGCWPADPCHLGSLP
ncbi:hypothetical protein [Acidovorax sacchari]|uniref:hypothetical protein n=1 Tax=Acidovorax sacchari TaxID=3230736 RepID=UPI0039E62CC2